jgi:hypothetical protein
MADMRSTMLTCLEVIENKFLENEPLAFKEVQESKSKLRATHNLSWKRRFVDLILEILNFDDQPQPLFLIFHHSPCQSSSIPN